jgi:hypothetical protein
LFVFVAFLFVIPEGNLRFARSGKNGKSGLQPGQLAPRRNGL